MYVTFQIREIVENIHRPKVSVSITDLSVSELDLHKTTPSETRNDKFGAIPRSLGQGPPVQGSGSENPV